jgi:serine beta-lactamase-like protein LACTB, mitochondrial
MSQRLPLYHLLLALLLVGQLSTDAAARPQTNGLPPAVQTRLKDAIAKEMADREVPGLSAAVAVDGKLAWSRGFGRADLENDVAATPTTSYRLASISKPITATAVLQLSEQKRVDLDAPVQEYVPEYPEKQWTVTVRHLLAHLGGVRHYTGPAEVNSTRFFPTLRDAMALFAADPLVHEPRTKYLYTTYGYNLLGRVVEGASGGDFMSYVQEQVFKPAGMVQTRTDSVREIIRNRAQGYRKSPEGVIQNAALADTSNKVPGGGLCGTVEDLIRFAVAHQEGKLVAAKTRDLMYTQQETVDGEKVPYGLGWRVESRKGMKEVFHPGGQPRVSTVLYTLPEKRLSIALMCNLEGTNVTRLARELSDILLSK